MRYLLIALIFLIIWYNKSSIYGQLSSISKQWIPPFSSTTQTFTDLLKNTVCAPAVGLALGMGASKFCEQPLLFQPHYMWHPTTGNRVHVKTQADHDKYKGYHMQKAKLDPRSHPTEEKTTEEKTKCDTRSCINTSTKTRGSHGQEAVKKAKNVILYGTPKCGWTVKQKQYFDDMKIPYSFVNCETQQCPVGMTAYPVSILPNHEKTQIVGFTEIDPKSF